MSKKIVFSLSKTMTIILATVVTMLLLVGCPSAEDKQAEDMLGTNVELPGIWESQSISYTFSGKSYSGTIQLRFTDKQLQIEAPHGISKVHGYTRNGISIDIEDPYSSPTITHSFVLEFSDGKFTTTLNDLEFMKGIDQKLTFNKTQGSASMLEPTDLEEEGSVGNTDIPAIGTEYNDEKNNLRYIVKNDRTLSVKEPIDAELADWVCIIPEEYEGIKVTSIGGYAFRGCSSLTSITIPDSVTSIGYYAFSGCSSLTSITIPGSVTSIGGYAFRGCSSLTSITIPDSVTSIGYYAFSGCSSLTSITIPGSVTSIGGFAFEDCTSLTSITIPDTVTSIGTSAFRGCSGLTSINIPDSVTSIGEGAFFGCSSLTSITIPNSVTSIGRNAFFGCSSLTDITIPGSVTSIEDRAFNGCSRLTSITVSDNNKFYKSIDGVLFDKNVQIIITYPHAKSSNNYTIPDSVTSIGDGAFWDCRRLTSITIPGSVTSIEDRAFNGCSRLNSITVSDNNKYYKSIDGVLFDKNVQIIIAYPCGKSSNYYTIPDSVTSIGNDAFSSCYKLTSIDIPVSVTSIGEGAFWNCYGLTSINIPDSVTSIGSDAFSYCSNLTSITINQEEGSISGSPWGAPKGESIVKWQGES